MLEDGARIAQALNTALIGFLLEGRALEAPGLGPSHELSPYVDKYGQEMERIGWTPNTFHDDYPVPIRDEVTRVRSWGLDVLADEAGH